jgi:hypothetical protein
MSRRKKWPPERRFYSRPDGCAAPTGWETKSFAAIFFFSKNFLVEFCRCAGIIGEKISSKNGA